MQTATQPRPEETEEWAPPAPCSAEEAPGAGRGDEAPAEDHPRRDRSRRRTPRREEGRLPLRTRVILGTAGGLLVVLGIAGLFLPFLQGILFLVLAAAVLSLTSRRIYHWLQEAIGERWPNAWERVERFRTRVRWKLRKK